MTDQVSFETYENALDTKVRYTNTKMADMGKKVIRAHVKPCELLGTPSGTISSQASNEEGSTTIESTQDIVEASRVGYKLMVSEAHGILTDDDIVFSAWEHAAADDYSFANCLVA